LANALKINDLEKQLLLQRQENEMLKRDLVLLKDKEREFFEITHRLKDMELRLNEQKNKQLVDVLKTLLTSPI